MKSIAAIIPAYNVAATIAQVIAGVQRWIDPSRIVVIDDGSTDATAQIAKDAGVVVLQNSTNQGKGAALKLGFEYVCANSFEAVITLDGDSQHDPAEIPRFMECYSKTRADLILGDRTGDFSQMPLDRQFSNKMTSLIISLLTGTRVQDSQSGYRLIKTEILKRLKLISHRYETESELLVKALRQGFQIAHVPIRTIYNAQPSHIHRLKDTLRFVRIVVQSCLWPN
ncbi:MAG: glycosyltransferase family 2 protein [candidate division KSB1 bacterium]|nr:glycosyltransferase family 2 protein [candidate division KSB1 bacterium]MDZ7318657.1 glycosyltransferase family 2 protein [candidate division KSB1 bacterium]MDZ7340036.1 glycosyltransferase family 2 protein [candidate division KSB1 bacterium]